MENTGWNKESLLQWVNVKCLTLQFCQNMLDSFQRIWLAIFFLHFHQKLCIASSSVSVSQAFPQDPLDNVFQDPYCSYSVLYFLHIRSDSLHAYLDLLDITLVGHVLHNILTWTCLWKYFSHGIIHHLCMCWINCNEYHYHLCMNIPAYTHILAWHLNNLACNM